MGFIKPVIPNQIAVSATSGGVPACTTSCLYRSGSCKSIRESERMRSSGPARNVSPVSPIPDVAHCLSKVISLLIFVIGNCSAAGAQVALIRHSDEPIDGVGGLAD